MKDLRKDIIVLAIYFLTFSLLNVFGADIVAANLIAFLISYIYVLITRRQKDGKSRILYVYETLIKLYPIHFCESILLVFVCRILGLNVYASKLLCVILILGFIYALRRFFPSQPKADGPKTLWDKLDLIDEASMDHKTIISGNITYILSFVMPFVICLVIFGTRQIYPFGDEVYLRCDMYHQYAPFYSELWYKLKTGGSFTYTWNIGYGVNFIALFAYYLSSPVNYFLTIFPQMHMLELMDYIIVFKMCLMSLSFTYYLTKHYNNKSIISAVLGWFYALSAYLMAYSWNIMWLDCLVFFPLIMLGLEQLVQKGKYKLYVISLSLCIISNYYISIMICIYIVIAFVYNMFIMEKPKYYYIYFKRIFTFCIFSLIAGGISAVLLLPEVAALKLTASSDITFPKTWMTYFPTMNMITRMLPGVETHIGLQHYPNIYCGSFVFLLFPLYFINKDIKTGEKIGKLLLLAVLLASFNMNVLNFIWHGFHFPNSLPARHSFIFVFIVLDICFEALIRVKSITKEDIIKGLIAAIAVLIILEQHYSGPDYKFEIFYVALMYIFAYTIILNIYDRSKIKNIIALGLVILIPALELGYNMMKTSFSTINRTDYLSNYDSMKAAIDYIEETDDSNFYRTEIMYGYRSKNDSAWHNMKGVSTFSSTAYKTMTDFTEYMGMESNYNAYSSHGLTAITSAIFNIRYIISSYEREEGDDYSLVFNQDRTYVYRNKYTLPMCYVANDEIRELTFEQGMTALDYQNRYMTMATGVGDMFRDVTTLNSGETTFVTPSKRCHCYLYCPTNMSNQVEIYVNDHGVSYGIEETHIIDLGYIGPEDYAYIANMPYDGKVYTIDEELFKEAFNKLEKNSIKVTEYSDNMIKGTLNTDQDGLAICCVTYDKGWTIYVDGKKIDYKRLNSSGFIAFDISEGEHEIVMKYFPENLTLGIMITILCLIAFVAIIISEKIGEEDNKKKRKDITL